MKIRRGSGFGRASASKPLASLREGQSAGFDADGTRASERYIFDFC